ncbi:uncharacterized protein LOC143424903 isoform X2 [Xylocopa sonorina]|uniref:uncharacterized protein LOC143424903 isoform X2 n=1 Tax=Xylocopa sonorina TaxID=1818115 RepID=UPI00403B2252
MEQVDEVQSDIIKIESLITIDTPPSVDTESNTDHTKKSENISEAQENSLQDCTDNIIQDASPVNDCDITDSSKEIKSKNNGVTIESLDNVIINEVKEEVIKNELQSGDNQCTEDEVCKENQTKKLDEIKTDLTCAEDISLDKESKKISNNVEVVVPNKSGQNLKKQNVCTVLNIDTVDDTNAQCQALIKTLSETFEDKDQSLQVADTDADLSKLVDGSSEVMVLTVETVDNITEENIVLTVHEKDTNSSNTNDGPAKQSETKKTEIINEDFNLIDYAQESDGTIIEVISTEIVDTEIPETCTQETNKESPNRATSEKDSITSTTSETTNKPKIVSDISIKEESFQEVCSNISERYDAEQPEVNDKCKTDICDSPHKINPKKDVARNKIGTPTYNIHVKEENVSLNEANKIGVTKKRSVIQDIFDDWGDENTEDDNQSVSKVSDTVEIELKSLLNDTKTQAIEEDTVVLLEEEITCIEKEAVSADTGGIEIIGDNKELQMPKEQTDSDQTIKKQNSIKSLFKDQINFSMSQSSGKSAKDTAHDTVAFTQTSSSQVQTMPINRGRNLTSQIASQAEVTEALKERLREKQKIVEAPPQPDIFFVKKLTQRLSSKLAGGPGSFIPALIPLPSQPNVQSVGHCDKKLADNTNTGTSKESKSDNKELLAILEGDVDPDWSNLKPPTLIEEGKRPVKLEQNDNNTPPKLDPLVERELALKQLLELPVASVKRSASKKKKTTKPTPVKAFKDVKTKTVSSTEKDIVNIDLSNEPAKLAEDATSDRVPSPLVVEVHTPEKSTDMQDLRLDESRSGRKRKLTEKAREHEQQQSIVKRQKVYKGKIMVNKKQPQTNESAALVDVDATTENHISKNTVSPVEKNEDDVTIADEVTNRQITNNNRVEAPLDNPETNAPLKSPKQSLSKKGSQSIAKRNIVAKKILKQNMPSSKKATLKAKLNVPSKKSGSKVVPKSKRSTENSAADPKPKKKIINEIDRLLQDEGVVNLLYDVEQPDKKRLIPITKSQAKVMDIQKVQRELKLRKRLVRNAVLRLRTSTGSVSKVSPRSKRTSIYLSDMQVDKKIGDQIALVKPAGVTPQEFILPAKIRNAADASIIIRRHSSSSFSSASGSPRVSVDAPEKIEGIKIDEGGSHSLRSMKRRHSQDEKANVKKSKKKTVQKNDTGTEVPDIALKDKVTLPARPSKKSDAKKAEKNPKQPEADETNNDIGKVVTRSNGTATGEDELSACLAEAANALSVVNAGQRVANSTTNRKSKANANTVKVLELDSNKTKVDTRSQFSNKEINVRRHGNLVQLILTPSSSTKIRNALTLQVMQEFRETLSILKKDDDCRVVLLTSTGSSFCEGLELSMLLHTNKEERRVHAQETADAVKDFIKTLASFNKPIVAGVQGAAVGLGVTMLPLFDLVIASDKATFSTPYGKLGQIAEGAAVFTLSHILGSAITSELLLGGRTLTASEALRAGLVTRVLWPDRFQVELLPCLKAMSEQSSQSMEATKALLRHSLRKKLDAALESETYLLIQHWCSVECQTAIKAYIDGKVQ